MRFGSTMVIGKPRLMHHSMPGEIRSFTLSMFWSVILSPGTTSARAPPARSAPPIASAAASPVLVLIVGPPAGSVARGHQRRDREPVVHGPVDLVVPLHGVVLRVNDAQDVALAQVLPVHPSDLARVAVVTVDVGVLAEERVGALRGGQATDPPQ